jgi:hypothetical protein
MSSITRKIYLFPDVTHYEMRSRGLCRCGMREKLSLSSSLLPPQKPHVGALRTFGILDALESPAKTAASDEKILTETQA